MLISVDPKWSFYISRFEGFKRSLLFGILGAVCAAGLLLSIPFLVRYVFNEVIPQQRYDILIYIALLALGVQAAYLGVTLRVRRNVFTVSSKVVRSFRREAIEKLYTLSDQAYSHLNRAGLHAKLIVGIDRIAQMTEALIGNLLPSVVIGALLMGGMLFVSWQLFLIALLVFSLLIPITRWTGNRVKQLARDHQDSVHSYSARLEFLISNFLLTKIKSAEHQELGIYEEVIKDVAHKGRDLAVWRVLYLEMNNFFAFTTAVVLLSVGVGTTTVGWMTLGDVLAFYVLAMLFRGQYVMFSHALTPVLEGTYALSTVWDVLTLKDADPYEGTDPIEFHGKVTLKDVYFGYEDELLLKNINLELRPGEITGVSGPNGCGKTTISKLIMGFYKPKSGQVLVDDKPLSSIDIRSYRRQLGVVLQYPLVFAGTIAENIGYGDPEPSKEKVRTAARIAGLDAFVARLADGYDTHIGDEGVLLSGGQKQRISIARAIYNEPKLLILDEPTNHIDSDSIDAILSNLTSLSQKPCILIISHDARALAQSHTSYYLEAGRLQHLDSNQYRSSTA